MQFDKNDMKCTFSRNIELELISYKFKALLRSALYISRGFLWMLPCFPTLHQSNARNTTFIQGTCLLNGTFLALCDIPTS